MICPLIANFRVQDCARQDCAWWDTKEESCAVLAINKHLDGINDSLAEIAANEVQATVSFNDTGLDAIQKDIAYLANTLKR